MTIEDSEDPRGWDEACRREFSVNSRELIARHSDRLTIAAIDAVAIDLRLSRSTVYRLLERYRAEKNCLGFVGADEGPQEGHSAAEARARGIDPRGY